MKEIQNIPSEAPELDSKAIEAEQAAKVEADRVNALRKRLDALEDIHTIAVAAGCHQPNMEIAKLDIIKNNDIEKLELLEKAHLANIANKKAEEDAKPMIELREKRDKLLAASDFSQLADVNLTTAQKQEYQQYRDYLRNLPSKIESGEVLMQEVKTFKEYKAK